MGAFQAPLQSHIPSALLFSQPFTDIVISLADFVFKWILVLVTLWVNLYKQGFRGVKGEKGEPGQPGLDGLDAPCQLVQYLSFLPPCMQFLCWWPTHCHRVKWCFLEQAFHDPRTTCMRMNRLLPLGKRAGMCFCPWCQLITWHCPPDWHGHRICVLWNINIVHKYLSIILKCNEKYWM